VKDLIIKRYWEISPWVWYLVFDPPFTHILFIVTSGELFAQCPLDGYPSTAMEQVLDYSRYFVISIQDKLGSWFAFGRPFTVLSREYITSVFCSVPGPMGPEKSQKPIKKLGMQKSRNWLLDWSWKSPGFWSVWSWKINLASMLVAMHLLLVSSNSLFK